MATATVSRPKTKKKTKKNLQDEIQGFVSLCFAMMAHYTLKEVADSSNLSRSTIGRLWNGKVSLCTHIGTIQKLGYAAGMKVELVDNEARVSLVD